MYVNKDKYFHQQRSFLSFESKNNTVLYYFINRNSQVYIQVNVDIKLSMFFSEFVKIHPSINKEFTLGIQFCFCSLKYGLAQATQIFCSYQNLYLLKNKSFNISYIMFHRWCPCSVTCRQLPSTTSKPAKLLIHPSGL